MAHLLLFTSILQSHPLSGQAFFSRFLSREVEAPAAAAAPQQKPIMNIPIPLPGSSNDNNDQPSTGSGDVIISDVIGKERSINIFAGFTRKLLVFECRVHISDLLCRRCRQCLKAP